MGLSGKVMNSFVYWTRINELHPHFVVMNYNPQQLWCILCHHKHTNANSANEVKNSARLLTYNKDNSTTTLNKHVEHDHADEYNKMQFTSCVMLFQETFQYQDAISICHGHQVASHLFSWVPTNHTWAIAKMIRV
jgi:hypothetical protein